MNPVRTKIELLLLVVFIGQTALLGYLLGVEFINNLRFSMVHLDIFTLLFLVFIYLVYRLIRPTARAMLVGAIVCASGSILATWHGGDWGWRLGPTISARLFYNDSIEVGLNINNYILCMLFIKARKDRLEIDKVSQST